MNRRIRLFLMSTAIAAPAGAGLAQDVSPDTAVSETAITDEIVVTGARGRIETALEVPISVTAYNEEEIEDARIDRVGDFITLTPNVTIDEAQNVGLSALTIRGVTQVRNGEPPVATVVDGVLQINSRQFTQELVDVERIEVLRGPQGALYGRNATGGAILITTKDPSNVLEGHVRAGIGRNEHLLQGAVSGPIVEDKLLFRAAARYSDYGGSLINETLGERVGDLEDITLRGKLLWRPTGNFEADLRASVSRAEGGGLNYVYQPAIVGPDGKPIALDFTRGDADEVSRIIYSNNPGFNERDINEFALKMDYDLGGVTLRSVSSYNDLQEYLQGDQFPYTAATTISPGAAPLGDGTQTQFVDIEAWSQEFRIISPTDQRLRWMAGVYYLETDRFISSTTGSDLGQGITRVEREPLFSDPANPTLTYFADDNDNTAWALFGNVDFDVTDRLELSAALRYDEDEREQTVSPLNTGGAPGAVNTATYDKLQPKLTARYQITPDFNVYASWGEGFRSGQFNQNGVGAAAAAAGLVGVEDVVDEEITETYELGFKGRLGDRLRLSGAVFDTTVEGQQYFVFVGAVGAQVLVNIDEVSLQGGELELAANLAEGLDAYASVGVTDSEVEEYALNPAAVGNKAPYVPDMTFNAGVQYRTAPYWNGLNLFGRVDYEHRGDQFWDPENSTARSAFDLVDLRFGIEHQEGGWSLIGTWNNVFDEAYNSEYVLGGFAHPAQPTQWRIDLRKEF